MSTGEAVVWALDAALGGFVVFRAIKSWRAKQKPVSRPTPQPVRHRATAQDRRAA
jgi:hypothetical protein